jgi:hypothetical protein
VQYNQNQKSIKCKLSVTVVAYNFIGHPLMACFSWSKYNFSLPTNYKVLHEVQLVALWMPKTRIFRTCFAILLISVSSIGHWSRMYVQFYYTISWLLTFYDFFVMYIFLYFALVESLKRHYALNILLQNNYADCIAITYIHLVLFNCCPLCPPKLVSKDCLSNSYFFREFS